MGADVAPVRLAFAIHNHQPVGNFDSVFSDATERAYRPFLDALARHPGVRVSMHWSGCLLEWLEARDPALLDRLGGLCAQGQVELLSGAFYEPILAAIPPWDQQGQIERMNDYLKSRFGVVPRGAWIAERVWEPDLPGVLSKAGIEYTLLDDHHFLLAGESPDSLREPYWIESTLGRVGVFPIERELRYRIPFQPVPEILNYLRSTARDPLELRVFGDDGEKFGVWPRTHDWVHREGWLEAWLTALESRREVEAVPLGDAWRAAPPKRRTALPAASYPEMMLWALPPERQVAVEADQRWLEAQGKPELALRTATGTWRQFLARYSEAGRAHRRVTALSRRIEHLRRSCTGRGQYEEARREIHRAQCNCSYWHGVFGGFYLPHLRQSVHEHWLRAESLADELQGPPTGWTLERVGEEIMLRSPRIAVAVSLDEGGAIAEIADRRRPFDFAGVIARRREAYHVKVALAATPHGASGSGETPERPETIHGGFLMKEPGLEKLLEYDGRSRCAAQEWVIREEAVAAAGRLRAAIGSGRAAIRFATAPPRSAGPERGAGEGAPLVCLVATDAPVRALRKEISPGSNEGEFQVRYFGLEEGFWLASEWNLSLLTGDAPGRRLAIRTGAGSRAFAPGSSGEADSVASFRLEDTEFLKLALTLEFEPEARLEWAAVETVSLSEAGVERLYQGTSFLIGWRVAPGGSARIRARIEESPAAP